MRGVLTIAFARLLMSMAMPLLFGLALCTWKNTAQAQLASAELPPSLFQILESLDVQHPQVEAARARIRNAEGQVLAADGAFDPVLQLSGSGVLLGYYTYAVLDAMLVQPTPLWGATFFAGYRYGTPLDRELPDYLRQRQTLSLGEFRAGGSIPLLRDGPIDTRRANQAQASLALERANFDASSLLLRLRAQAADAYFRWLSACARRAAADRMYNVAHDRQSQIETRAREGLIASIESIENQRIVIEREAFAIRARRAVEQASIALSFYTRDENGFPEQNQCPDAPEQQLGGLIPFSEDGVSTEAERLRYAQTHRPELRIFDLQIDSARIATRLAENRILPRLDLNVTGASDLGNSSNTTVQSQLNPFTLEGSVTFSMPLFLREGRGAAEAARQEQVRLEQEGRAQIDRVGMEVRDASSLWQAADERYSLAERQLVIALQLLQAEQTKFESGASTVFMVNQREMSALQSTFDMLEALAERSSASVILAASMADPRILLLQR